MKLFTKEINTKLFAQYPKGNDLANQVVIAKIFNPYGRGVWYLINSDPEDPDYIWAIVDLFEPEIGSVSRSELESIKVPPYRLGLERDTSFSPKNAQELFQGVLNRKRYAKGGEINKSGDQEFIVETSMQYEHIFAKSEDEARHKWNQLHSKDTIKDSIVSIKKAYAKGGSIEDENVEMVRNQNKAISHHTKELQSQLDMGKDTPAWVVSKVSRASNDLSDVTHYMDGEKMANGGGVGTDYESDVKVQESDGVNYLVPPDAEDGDLVVSLGNGGEIDADSLTAENSYLNVWSMGVLLPSQIKIVSAKSSAGFSRKSLILTLKDGFSEYIYGDDIQRFLSGKQIEQRDTTGQPYAIQWAKLKVMAKGGGVEKIGKVMHEFKEGTLHSGKSGKVVTDKKQAIAIALSEAKLSKTKRGWSHKSK
jgi:hypothetical protein